MSLPLSRNTTYGTTSPIKSNDLDDIQDKIIALYARATKSYTQTIVFHDATQNVSSQLLVITAVGTTIFIPAEIGAQIIGYRVTVRDSVSGTNTVSAQLGVETAGTPGAVAISGTAATPSSGGGTFQTLNKSGLSVDTVSDRTYSIMLGYATGSGTFHIQMAEVEYQRFP